MIERFLRVLEELVRALVHLNRTMEKQVAAIDDLNSAVTDLTTAANAAIAKINAGDQSPAIENAVTSIKAVTDALNTVVNPPAP